MGARGEEEEDGWHPYNYNKPLDNVVCEGMMVHLEIVREEHN